ncbi:phasin family protein [Oleisolibacter albus]|uniref:phasin family protein n=1 Tax=Oleisolibacter albus TaxID=2171757 RepID=UPI000DF3942F|nr:phasin family protein [Oleisolibacter albus]
MAEDSTKTGIGTEPGMGTGTDTGSGSAGGTEALRQGAERLQASQRAMTEAGQIMSQRGQQIMQEWMRTAQGTLERRAEQMRQLAAARSVTDVMRLQAEIMQAEYSEGVEFARRVSDIAMETGREIMQRGTAAG